MKNYSCTIFFGFLLFIAYSTNAQTLIAVQNESGSSFYSNLDTAIVKAKAGDYIYLPGGNFNITKPIDKKLHIVGVGHNPDSCVVTGITQVTGNFTIKPGSDHGSIAGLKLNGSVTFSVGSSEPFVNYYSIERCNFSSLNVATRSSNILVKECVINGNVSGSSSQGFLLTKCIVTGGVYGFIANSFADNNLFLNTSMIFESCFFRNNIFLCAGPNPSAVSTTLYQNNSFTSAVASLHNCHNNIVAPVSGLFKNKTKTGFDYDQDYHVLATSPAYNAGTDGNDLGIYGTASPWKEGSLPGNPHVQKVQSKTVSTIDGKLEVKTKIAAQDY